MMQSEHTAFDLRASDDLAIKDDRHDWIDYAELVVRVDALRAELSRNTPRDTKALMFLYADNSISSVVAYVAGVNANYVVAFLDPNLPEAAQQDLATRYSPDITLSPSEDAASALAGYRITRHDVEETAPIYPPTAVLLSTSGSTGTPKFVRLSRTNMLSNADAIVRALHITPADRALAHLPMHYSYGLSIVTSHLQAGAALSMTNHTFMQRPFWPRLKADAITNLSGVPWHYETMARMGPQRLGLGGLTHMTQAGGRLAEPDQATFQDFMNSVGGAFHVMYGQTEAAPRITTRSHAAGQKSLTSVGAVLHGGRIDILDADGAKLPAGETGQVVYSGPNVMLGYAQSRADLAHADKMGGTLHTGDLGVLDADGELRITGRADRMVKVAGLRVNLDDLQKSLEAELQTLIVYVGGKIQVHVIAQGDAATQTADVLARLQDKFSIPPTAYKIIPVADFPLTSRGKLDYKSAAKALETPAKT